MKVMNLLLVLLLCIINSSVLATSQSEHDKKLYIAQSKLNVKTINALESVRTKSILNTLTSLASLFRKELIISQGQVIILRLNPMVHLYIQDVDILRIMDHSKMISL